MEIQGGLNSNPPCMGKEKKGEKGVFDDIKLLLLFFSIFHE